MSRLILVTRQYFCQYRYRRLGQLFAPAKRRWNGAGGVVRDASRRCYPVWLCRISDIRPGARKKTQNRPARNGARICSRGRLPTHPFG
jgi:hypothetical protein